MKSSLKNMILTLLVITLFSAISVCGVFLLTKDAIAEAKDNKITEAIGMVLPEFDNNISQSVKSEEKDGGEVKVYTATKGGEVVGYAVETFSNNGYSGLIRLMVGFLADGTIKDIQVLEQTETPGLGSEMAKPGNKLEVSFVGKNPSELKMKVVNDGGDIDVLSASTISSRAYTEAVERAYNTMQALK